jgi:hypothetical protein
LSENGSDAISLRDQGLEIRERIGWGARYFPPIDERPGERQFREICDDLCDEIGELQAFIDGEKVTAEGAGAIAEIEHLLEQLYECSFGGGDYLKNSVVCIRFQLSNANWTAQHAAFLRDVVDFIRSRYTIDDAIVDQCYDMVNEHGLDVFRGTVSEPETVHKYRIVEVTEEHA